MMISAHSDHLPASKIKNKPVVNQHRSVEVLEVLLKETKRKTKNKCAQLPPSSLPGGGRGCSSALECAVRRDERAHSLSSSRSQAQFIRHLQAEVDRLSTMVSACPDDRQHQQVAAGKGKEKLLDDDDTITAHVYREGKSTSEPVHCPAVIASRAMPVRQPPSPRQLPGAGGQ